MIDDIVLGKKERIDECVQRIRTYMDGLSDRNSIDDRIRIDEWFWCSKTDHSRGERQPKIDHLTDHLFDEPEGELLGQCAGGKLLRDIENGMRSQEKLPDA